MDADKHNAGPRGVPVVVLKGHDREVHGVAWSPDGTRIASASGGAVTDLDKVGSWRSREEIEWRTNDWKCDNTVRVWDAASGRELACLSGHADSVRSVQWSPGGTRVASRSEDGTLRLWDAATGRELACVPDRVVIWSQDDDVDRTTETQAPNSAVVSGRQSGRSPDGRRDASNDSSASEIKVCDTASGAELARLSGHRKKINDLAASPDGSRLASASDDFTVRVWDLTGV